MRKYIPSKKYFIFSLIFAFIMAMSAICSIVLPSNFEQVTLSISSDVSNNDVSIDTDINDEIDFSTDTISENWSSTQTSNIQVENNSMAISSAEDLAQFAKNVNAGNNYSGITVYLTSNIDLSGKIWTPIGNSSSPFSGIFDGRGYTISGLTINETTNYSTQGLFGTVSSQNENNIAVIRNVVLRGVNIRTNAANVGGIAGYVYVNGHSLAVQIINCGVSGYINSTRTSNAYVGGIVGSLYNSGIHKCFSTATINGGSNSYLGGICGLKSSGNATNASISQSFYFSEVGISGSGQIGGIAGSSDTSYIVDVYTNASNITPIFSGTLQNNLRYSTTSFDQFTWAADTTGIMHGIVNAYILKGVGNIYIEVNNYKANYDATNGSLSEEGESNVFIYNVLNDRSIGNASYNESNYNYPYVKTVRHDSTKATQETDVIYGAGAFYDLNSQSYNSTYVNSSSYYTNSDISFDISTDNAAVGITLQTLGQNIGSRTFNTGKLSGYYTIDLHARGVWQKVDIGLNEYSQVNANGTEGTGGKIRSQIHLIQSYASLYSESEMSEPTSNGMSNVDGFYQTDVLTVYVPYGESFKIRFDGQDYDGIDYLAMMSGWGNASLPIVGGIGFGNISVHKEGESVSATPQLPESNVTYIWNGKINVESAVNFYFNNIQQVDLILYDENLDQSMLNHLVAGNYPTFVNSGLVSSSNNTISYGELTVNIMVGRPLYENGICVTGSQTIYGQNTSIANSSVGNNYHFPYWSEYHLNGFYMDGEKFINNNIINSSVAELQLESLNWNFEHQSENRQLVAQWTQVENNTLVINFQNENDQNAQKVPINSAVSSLWILRNSAEFSYAAADLSNGELKYGEFQNSVITNSRVLNVKSNEQARFTFTLANGYEIASGALLLTLKNGSSIEIPLRLMQSSNGYSFLYSCIGENSNIYVSNQIWVTIDATTGEVEITFKHLMGIDEICVIVKPQEFNVTVNANLSSTIIGNPTVISFDHSGRSYSLDTSYTNLNSNYLYGTDIVFENVDVKFGYTYDRINVYINDDQLVTNFFSETRDGNTISMSPLSWTSITNRITNIRFEFCVTRNSGNITFNIEGLEKQYLVGNNVLITMGGRNLADGSGTYSQQITTDATLTFGFTILDGLQFASIYDVQMDYDGCNFEMSGWDSSNVGTQNLTLSFSQFAMRTNGQIVVTIKLRVSEANINVIQQNTVLGTVVSEKELASGTLTYGTHITKNSGENVIYFDDRNNNENSFSISLDLDFSEISAIRIYKNSLNTTPIADGGSFDVTLRYFEDGDSIDIIIEFVLRTAQVNILNGFVRNGQTAFYRTENTSQQTCYIDGNPIELTQSGQTGYEFLGWYYVVGDDIVNTSNLSYSNLTKIDDGIDQITLVGQNVVANQGQMNIRNFMYFIAVYEAKIFNITFDNSEFFDDVQDLGYQVSGFDNLNQFTIEYDTNTIVGGDFPVASLVDNNMWNFEGYTSQSNVLTVDFFDDVFDVRTNWANVSADEIVLSPKFSPKDVTLYYCDQNGNRTGSSITVTYGDVPTTQLSTPSATIGYTFGGWSYQGEIYYPYDSQNGWGQFRSWTAMVLEADLIPVLNAINNTVTIHAGLGTFQGENQSLTATVAFGSNIYIMPNINFTQIPSWTPSGASYVFAGYYKAVVGGKEYRVYGTDNANNSVCDFVSNDVTFYACYELVSVDATLFVDGQSSTTWEYRGNSYNLSLNFSQNLPISLVSQAFSLNGQDVGSSVTLKDVSQSGEYTCTVNFSGYDTLSGGVGVYTVGNVEEQVSIVIEITPLQLGISTPNITKVFDNTTSLNTVTLNGIIEGDIVYASMRFADKNVGQNKQVIVTLSGQDASNYTTPELTGEITPYIIAFNVSGVNYKIGDDNQKIVLGDENISIESSCSRFLTSIGVSASIKLQTSQNVVGTYTYGGALNLEVVFFTLSGTDVNEENFDYSIEGEYQIVDAGLENVVISVNVHCDDESNIDISSIASLYFAQDFEQITGNNTASVQIVDFVSYFQQNPRLEFSVNRSENYWVDRVLVNNVLTQVNYTEGQISDTFVYDVSDKIVSIDIYITTLSEVTLDYALSDGETLSGYPTSTKFAYQKTVQQSIDAYGSVLPQNVDRAGFVFIGWKLSSNNTFISTDSTWSYKKGAVLVAQYELADIEVEQVIDDVINSPLTNQFLRIFDAQTHEIVYNVTNSNDYAIRYTYSWTKNNAQQNNSSNTLSVLNVSDTGNYVLTITAVMVQNSLVYKTRGISLEVNILPYGVFDQGEVITKQYDGNALTPSITKSLGSTRIVVFGAYKTKNAGSSLDTTLSNWTINGVRADANLLNYTLNFDAIDSENSIIEKRDVVLNIGLQSKVYDGEILSYNGTHSETISFSYVVSSTSANVGTYNQSNNGLSVEIINEDINNLNVNISGSIIISIEEVEISWTGATTVTFDGEYHSISPVLPSYVQVTGITYTNEETTLHYQSLQENVGAIDAGTYIVSFTFENTNSNISITSGTSATLTISKRTIYVGYNGLFDEKAYDSTTNISADCVSEAVAYDNPSLTTLLDNVITNESKLPAFEYAYESATAGDNKNIIVSLVDDTNYIISSSRNTVTGKIHKLDVTAYIAATKTYDATSNFIVGFQNITIDGIIDDEIVAGSITFMGVRNSGIYYNLNSINKTFNLTIGGYAYNTNYNLTFIDSILEEQQGQNYLKIEKAVVTVSTDTNKQYTYTGKEIELEYAFFNELNVTVVPSKTNVQISYTANDGSLDNGKAVQVGTYSYTLTLSGEDETNFTLTGDVSNVRFYIVAREILIYFPDPIYFSYQGKDQEGNDIVVEYLKDNGQQLQSNQQSGTDRMILASGYTLGYGDTMDWSFKTRSGVVGTYYINDQNQVQSDITVSKDGVDYTKNYSFQFERNSAIIIEPSQLDFRNIDLTVSTSVYDGQVKQIELTFVDMVTGDKKTFVYSDDTSEVTFTDFTFTNALSEVSDIQSPQDIIYAGTYAFGLQFTNYTLTNAGTLTYTITPKKLDVSIGERSKVYDGSTTFGNFTVNGIISGDQVFVVGNYSQKDVGNNLPITFAISSNISNVRGSYYIDQLNVTGDITQKDLSFELKINPYTSYYTNSPVEIDISYFNISGLVENDFYSEILSGSISFGVTELGNYDCSNISNITYNLSVSTQGGATSYLSNYNITGVSGNIEILRAHISVSVTEAVKTYNGSVQSVVVEYTAVENRGQLIQSEIASSFEVTYYTEDDVLIAPIDVGVYKVVISAKENSNYILVDESNQATMSFTSSVRLIIQHRQIEVNVNYTHIYDGNVASYQIQPANISDPTSGNGGLVDGHIFAGTLLTNSREADRYSISGIVFDGDETLLDFAVYPQNVSITILSNNQDVTGNYIITYNAVIVIVANIQNVDSSNIQNIEYCASDVTDLEDFYISFTVNDTLYQIGYGVDKQVTFGQFTASLSNLEVLSENEYTAKDEAVDVGRYRMTLSVISEDEELSAQNRYVEFSIYQKTITQIEGDFNKYYDTTTDVISDLTSPQIFDVDKDYVTILGYYQSFSVGTHNIEFTLDGDRAFNYTISLTSPISGTISRQPIVLTLTTPFSVYYTGEYSTVALTQFKAFKSDDTDVEIINFTLAGNVEILEVNVSNYDLAELYAAGRLRENIEDNNNILTNYQIVGYSGEYTINPCQIEINITNREKTYTSQGQGVEYSYQARAGYGSIPSSQTDILTVLYDGQSDLPINAGTYNVTISINENHAQNYLIYVNNSTSSSADYGTFTINRRQFAINIGNDVQLPYTENLVQYNLQNNDIIATSETISGLISTHTVAGYYETSGYELGIYIIGATSNYLTLFDFDILENGVSVLDNYIAVSDANQTGSVEIRAAQVGDIDTSHIEGLVYSAKDFVASRDIYITATVLGRAVTFYLNESNDLGQLTDLRDENGNSVTVAYNAGKYSVRLISDYLDLENDIFEFTISKRQITNITYTHDKSYDGTSLVVGEIIGSEVYSVDRDSVIILGNYVDILGNNISTVGDHYVSFTFSPDGTGANNYELPTNYLNFEGSILARDIVLKLNSTYNTYYTNQPVEISAQDLGAIYKDNKQDISDFTTNITGSISLNILNAGSYNLDNYFHALNIQSLEGSYIDNFNIVGITGTLVINKAQIVVLVSDYEKTYNGEIQTPTYTLSINNNNGAIVEEHLQNLLYAQYQLEGTTTYILNPTNAGTYSITLSISSEYNSNYTLYFNDQTTDLITTSERLVIAKRDITIEVNHTDEFTGSNIVYNIFQTDVQNLCEGHVVVGTLTTNGSKGGEYTLQLDNFQTDGNYSNEQIIPNITIMHSNQNTTANYNISIDATIFILSQLKDFDQSTLSNLVYDKTDKLANGDIVVKLTVDGTVREFVYTPAGTNQEATFTNLMYNGELTTSAVYVGQYSFDVAFNINGSTYSQSVTFEILPKPINLVSLTNNKVYDATNFILGDITSADILQGDVVEIAGEYSSVNVGTHNILLSLGGQDSFNYSIDNESLALSGQISARNITLSMSESANIVYSGDYPQITADMLSVGGLGLVPTQYIDGYLSLLRVDAGTYNFGIANLDTSNMQILSEDGQSVTSNYNISYSGNVTINTFVAEIIVEEIDFTYDAQIKDIRPLLGFDSLVVPSTIMEEALSSIVITYDNTPLNAGTYNATLSSNSPNFTITYGDNNIINFQIKKRPLQINIGEIEYQYNPTSNHQTQFNSTHLTGLVNGQIVEGQFSLNATGVGIGNYTFESDPYKIVYSLAIYVNGENILPINYELNDEKLGSIEIVAFELSSTDVWLRNNSITYNGIDISSSVTVYFYDANRTRQQITTSDTTYGSFEIVGNLTEDNSAINVGEYSVVVDILNYQLEQNTYALNITPKTITYVSYDSSKIYDGNSYVYYYQDRNLPSDIVSADRGKLVLYGYYVDEDGVNTKDVGVHNVKFEFQNANSYPALNYIFSVQGQSEILAKDVNLEISYDFAYSQSGSYTLVYEENTNAFSIEGLLQGDTLSGSVSLNGLGGHIGNISSNVDLSMLIIYDAQQNNVTNNYNIEVLTNLNIVKAQIDISFEDIQTIYTYNNAQISIIPTLSFINSSGQVELSYLDYQYVGNGYTGQEAPRNVGEYTITYAVAPMYSEYYEIVGDNSFTFTITEYGIELQVGEIPQFSKMYGEADPILSHTIMTTFGESVVITFNRDLGEELGSYDIHISEWDNNNYQITLAQGAGDNLFVITKAGRLDVVIENTQNNIDILQKVYDAQNIADVDISSLDYSANGEILTGKIKFALGKDVGEYQLATSGHTLENSNYQAFNVTSLLPFVIKAKPISLQITDGDKEYDASNTFLGDINILDSDGNPLGGQYLLSVSASFSSSDVGNNVSLNLTYCGDDISNYIVTNELTANIIKRSITITPHSDQIFDYGTQNFEITYDIIDNGTSTFNGNWASEIEGKLYIQSYDAGSWPIMSNITSQNLNITFTKNVILTINQKLLTITSSDNFQKVYDSTTDVIGTLTIEGIIPGDDVTITANYDSADVGDRRVTFNINGEDKDNYYTQDVFGRISERVVTLHYEYVTDSTMLNQDLMQNTSRESDVLSYGISITNSIGALPIPSHEGYTFIGWYLDEDVTVKLNDDTVINESIWSLDEQEKTAYARWEIKTFSVSIIVATRVDGEYVTNSSIIGGTHQNIDGRYEYGEVILLDNMAHPNTGYEFVGYSTDLLIGVDDDITANGLKVGANDITLYAKFAPLTVQIILNANGGAFETLNSLWTFNDTNTIATREFEFNAELGLSLPSATKQGYIHDITQWEFADGSLLQIDENTILDEDFYPSMTLFAHYEATSYRVSLDANGGYFEESEINPSIWTVEQRDEDNRPIVISKAVIFNRPIGAIIIPKHDGYAFAGWNISNFDSDYIWQTAGNASTLAQWEEVKFSIEITAQHGMVAYEVIGSDSSIILQGRVENGTSTIEVSTSNNLRLTAIADAGYTFSSWSSDVDEFNEKTTSTISNTQMFISDGYVVANFSANDNTITIIVENPSRGYAQANGKSTQDEDLQVKGQFDVIIKTGEELTIEAVNNEGYYLSNWIVTDDAIFQLSGSNQDTQRVLSGFVSDIEIVIYFEPYENEITIYFDNTKATITYNEETINTGNFTARAKTESILEFNINSLHGYKVDLSLTNWAFETISVNKGNFTISSDDDGKTVNVKFDGFTNNGTIVIPFVNDTFNVEVQVVLKDDSKYTLTDVEDILQVNDGEMIVSLSSGDSFGGEYLSQLTLSAQEIIPGYEFLSWSTSGTTNIPITAQTGFVEWTQSGDLVYSIVNNMTLYLIYEIQKYDVKFSVNNINMGMIRYGENITATSVTNQVKFGYSSMTVSAVSNDYFRFDKWVRVEGDSYVDYSTNSQITVQNVTQNCEFVAIFVGVDMTFTISLTLPNADVFTNSEIDFASLQLKDPNETVTTIVSSTREEGTNKITYEISTLTGQDIDFIINISDGYVYESSFMDPRVIYTLTRFDSYVELNLENLYLETAIDFTIRAEVHTISFALTGAPNGAEIYEDASNATGVVSSEYSMDRRTLDIKVKTGGDVSSILYILTGYKLAENNYFEQQGETTFESGINAIYRGLVSDVRESIDVAIVIEPIVYKVTFDLCNPELENSQFVSTVSHGSTNFSPQIDEIFTNPTRDRYNFVGYNSNPTYSGNVTYFFDQNGIYSEQYINNSFQKVYGFVGSDYMVASTEEGIDYDVVLYAEWQIQRYSVNLVFVPGFAVDSTNIFNTIVFPNSQGRWFVENELGEYIGVQYEPESIVTFQPPAGISDRFEYYGWSYRGDITSRVDDELYNLPYQATMGHEDITIYLYYTMEISVSSTDGGTATVSQPSALYGETISLSAIADYGYVFDHWIENALTIENSTSTMNIIATAPTIYQAVFVGERVNVNINQVQNATLTIISTTGTIGEYRVGDTITLQISDITYGYEHRGWQSSEYSGNIRSVDTSTYTYTILPQDFGRGYVTFSLSIAPKTLKIHFTVEGSGGAFNVDGVDLTNFTLSFVYDTTVDIVLNTFDRYELISYTLNGVEIEANTPLQINSSFGFICEGINEIKAEFRQLLWIEVWEPFTGSGTEENPYVIVTEQQLAAMAYLINNGIEAEGTIPYAQGYYVVRRNMLLSGRFWQPIGTQLNPFAGTFNLQGYRVSDLELDKAYEVTYLDGLFGYITDDARFITDDSSYITTVIIICSVTFGLLLIIAIIILILVLKRKKMRKISEASTINSNIMTADDLINSQKIKSQKQKSKRKK